MVINTPSKPSLPSLKWIFRSGYVNGRWVDSLSKKTFVVSNPADGSELAKVADFSKEDVSFAIQGAHTAFQSWRKKTAKERSRILRQWFDLMMAHQEDLALLLTAEQGKPLTESRVEIAYGASFIEWFAEEAKRAYGDLIPEVQSGQKIVITKEPIGVVAAITPWNFPVAMITRKVGPALAAGCTILVKPAEETPLSALALAALGEMAGLPPGVFNVLPTTDAVGIGEELTTHPLIKKVSFTGSTEVGKVLMRQSSSTLKKLSLELGGNAPFIVFEDADLDAAVRGAVISKYRNSGQTCVCTNRFLIHSRVYETFSEKLKAAVSELEVGAGHWPQTQQGPLINFAAVEKVESLLKDAISQGAQVRVGGRRHSFGRTFFEPTILTEVTSKMKITQEEVFGPVSPLLRFHTEEEAIRMANDTPYGLASYIYTKEVGRAWRIAEALECGMVGINEGLISSEVAPFGGVKESGFGREGSRYGLHDYLNIKYMLFGGLSSVIS